MKPYDYQLIPDGYFYLGHLAPTVQLNLLGSTYSSAYLIVNAGESCLIDTSITAQHSEAIGGMIESSRSSLKYIILTHDHFDHVANAAEIRKEYGGKVLVHRLDRPMIENPLLLFSEDATEHFPEWSLDTFLQDMNLTIDDWSGYRETIETYLNYPLYPNNTLEDNQILNVGKIQLKILHTPGHSPGSISIHNMASGSLYVGDLNLFPKRPFPIGNVSACEKSLLRIKAIGASYLGLGHEDPISGCAAVRRYVTQKIEALWDEEERILLALDNYPELTVEALCNSVFPGMERYRKYPNPDIGTYGHVFRLYNENILTKIIKNKITYWKLA